MVASRHRNAQDEHAGRSINVVIAPSTGPDGLVSNVRVGIEYGGLQATGGSPLFSMPHVYGNAESSANWIQIRHAHDDLGPLAITPSAKVTEAAESRTWSASREPVGVLGLTYEIEVRTELAPRGPAAPVELRSEPGSFSGLGRMFLLLPDDEREYTVGIRWDLSGLDAGALAVSSFGVGDTVATATPARLADMFFMAGDIRVWPSAVGQRRFIAAWQGEPSFDAAALMSWTEQLYEHYCSFFGDEEVPQCYVFMRPNLVNSGGGVARPGIFITTFDGSTTAADLRGTIAHEMVHAWRINLDDESWSSSWFAEGMATFYGKKLTLRHDMTTPDEFLLGLNFIAGRYYTNALAGISNDEAAQRFWEDTRCRTVPYDRGYLYLAHVDAEIHAKSGGAQSLDDLLHAMLEIRCREGHMNVHDWEELVRQFLGEMAVAEFRAIQSGKVVVPQSDAFGSQFRRTVRQLRRYDLGFEPKVLMESPRIVRNLDPASAAARAGLRDGDEITKPVGQDIIQGEQNRMLRMEIRRGDQDLVIEYLPRGEYVDAYQWELNGSLGAS